MAVVVIADGETGAKHNAAARQGNWVNEDVTNGSTAEPVMAPDRDDLCAPHPILCRRDKLATPERG